MLDIQYENRSNTFQRPSKCYKTLLKYNATQDLKTQIWHQQKEKALHWHLTLALLTTRLPPSEQH